MNKKMFAILLTTCFLSVCACEKHPDEQHQDSGGSNTISDIHDDSRPTGESFENVSQYSKLTPSSQPEPVNVPVDPAYASGGKTNKFRLEGEWGQDAVINGTATSNTWKNKLSIVNNTVFDFKFSNKLATRNFNSGNMGAFNLQFTSNKTYLVNAKLFMSIWDDSSSHLPFTVASYLELKTTGTKAGAPVSHDAEFVTTQLTVEDTKIMAEPVGVDTKYMRFATVDTKIAVFEGANKLEFTFIGGGGANIDYIELDTSASITDIKKTYFNNNSKWSVTTFPTETTAGVFTVTESIDGGDRTMSYPIPAFMTGGKLSDGYKKVTVEGKELYAFEFMGKDVTIDANKKITIKIKTGSDLKFKGGKTSIEIPVGGTLTADDFEPISGGRSIEGINIYDAKGALIKTGELGKVSFDETMDSIDVGTYSAMEGFTRLKPGNEQSSNKPQSNTNSYTGNMPADNWEVVSGNTSVIHGGTSGFAQIGNVFKYNSEIKNGYFCRINTVVNSSNAVLVLNKEHQFEYNFENLGTSAIHVKVFQVNSGVTEEDEGHVIDLEPGQSTTLLYKVTFKKGSANKNALTKIVATQDMKTGYTLGISMAVKVGK